MLIWWRSMINAYSRTTCIQARTATKCPWPLCELQLSLNQSSQCSSQTFRSVIVCNNAFQISFLSNVKTYKLRRVCIKVITSSTSLLMHLYLWQSIYGSKWEAVYKILLQNLSKIHMPLSPTQWTVFYQMLRTEKQSLAALVATHSNSLEQNFKPKFLFHLLHWAW